MTAHSITHQPQSGFTLLELLVAVALMAVVLMGVSAAFQGMVTLYSTVQEQRTNAMQSRLLLGLLADDFRSLAPQGGLRTESGADRETGIFGSTSDQNAALFQHLVTFVSSVSVNQKTVEPDLSLQRVSYELWRDTPDELWTLVRSERRHPFIDGDIKAVPMKVVGNVVSFRLRFERHDGTTTEGWSSPEWRLEPGQARPALSLPRAVHVELTLGYGSKQEDVYELRIPLLS